MNIEDGVMTKAEVMDKLMDSYEKGISKSDIFNIVQQVFKFELNSIPHSPSQPRAAIDAYLEQCGNKVTGAEIRKMINHTFSINLDALSALEGAKISLYSKNQWMLRHEKDLFVVHTGTGDVDVSIVPTSYYTDQTGSSELPIDLINALISLGFYYEKNKGSYYFSNLTGEPVSDAFKGKTIMAITKVIQHSCSHL